MTQILITGASGFAGRFLCHHLAGSGIKIRAVSRQPSAALPDVEMVTIHSWQQTPWDRYLEGVDGVIHLAARAHILKETAQDPQSLFMETNRDWTTHLTREAAKQGVQQFIYMSSAGVYGLRTRQAAKESDSVHPHNAYTRSKLAGEEAVRQSSGKMNWTIVRPPLMYGPGVKANFHRLLAAVDRGRPLPFAGIKNQRSYLGLANLAGFMETILLNPKSYGHIFNVADGEDLSTPDLVQKLADALGKKVFLWPFPKVLAMTIFKMAGKESMAASLWDDLQVDITAARQLGWNPPFTMDQQLAAVIREYEREKKEMGKA